MRRKAGFVCSFWEVLIAVVIVALVFGTIIQGYISTALRGQWTGYSLAAQSLGMQIIERSRSAVWDISSGKNELTNLTLINRSWNNSTKTLTGYTTNILDVPMKSTNSVLATNFVTVKILYANNFSNVPVQIQSVQVQTVWPFTGWNRFKTVNYYTNTVITYIAPDNRAPESLGVDVN